MTACVFHYVFHDVKVFQLQPCLCILKTDPIQLLFRISTNSQLRHHQLILLNMGQRWASRMTRSTRVSLDIIECEHWLDWPKRTKSTCELSKSSC